MNLRGIFLNNFGLKLTSLVLAALIWFQAASQQDVQRSISIPVEIVRLPSSLIISNEYARTLSLTVETKRGAMDDARASFVIDLRDARAGERIGIPVVKDRILIPNKRPEFTILAASPAVINLNIERIVHKFVPIEPEITGAVPEDFELLRVAANPAEIEISGPKSAIEQVESAPTVPIDVDEQRAAFRREVAVLLNDDRLRASTPIVQVWVMIEERRRTVELKVPVQIFPGDPPARVTPVTVLVTASVPVSFTAELAPRDFSVMIRTEGLEPRTQPYEVTPDVADVIAPERYQGVFRAERVGPVRVTRRP